MRVWLYISRNGETKVFREDHRHLARAEQDDDNGATAEEIAAFPDIYGDLDFSGHANHGDFSIDDGGSITLLEVE